MVPENPIDEGSHTSEPRCTQG